MATFNNVTAERLSPPAHTRYIRDMPRSNILVVVIDGLRASALGAYGNTTYPTSALDRLAAQSLVFDACYAPAVELADVYSALWQARYSIGKKTTPTLPAEDRDRCANLPRRLGESGYQTTLVTDDRQLLEFEGGRDFDDCVQVACHNKNALATDLSATSLAQLFAAAGEVIERSSAKSRAKETLEYDRPDLLWLHARGLFGPWDAPLNLQESQLDSDDPSPILSATPSDFRVGYDDDPDIVFRHGVAYAAQIMVLDECWQNLSHILPPRGAADEWLVLLLGGRGYCLGEHQQIGGIDPCLPVEQLHVPWLIQFPDRRGRLARSSALVSHIDVMPTLLDWIGNGRSIVPDLASASVLPLAEPTGTGWRPALLSAGKNGAYSIRNSLWTLRGIYASGPSHDAGSEKPFVNQATSPQLFVRPDDRWEANDVAKLCPEVVEELQAIATTALRQLQTGEVPSLMKLRD